MLHRVCRVFRLSILNKDTFPTFTKHFKQSPTFQTVKPYIRWQNNPALLQLAIRAQLSLQDRYKLLEEMDKVAKLQTQQDLNVSANIKKHLSISYMSRGDFDKAVEYSQDGLKILRMMENPHPVELASFIHNLGEAHLVKQPTDQKGINYLNEAITLFQEAYKLEPDNPMLVNNLAFCYSRLTWCYLFKGDLFKARQVCTKAQTYWSQIDQKKNRNYSYFVQGKCLLYLRFKQTEQLIEQCKKMVRELEDPYSRVWFLNILSSNNLPQYSKQLKDDMAALEKVMKKQQFQGFKKMIESLK